MLSVSFPCRYMVDAADQEKIEASKNELHNLLDKPQLQGIPVSCCLGRAPCGGGDPRVPAPGWATELVHSSEGGLGKTKIKPFWVRVSSCRNPHLV